MSDYNTILCECEPEFGNHITTYPMEKISIVMLKHDL